MNWLGSKKNTRLYFLPLVVWTVVILAASLWPAARIPELDVPLSDKWGHFVAYAILSFLAIYAGRKSERMSNNTGRWFIYTFILASVYGCLLEFAQGMMFFGRSFEYMDMAANSGGSAIGLLLGWLWLSRTRT